MQTNLFKEKHMGTPVQGDICGAAGGGGAIVIAGLPYLTVLDDEARAHLMSQPFIRSEHPLGGGCSGDIYGAGGIDKDSGAQGRIGPGHAVG